MILPVLTTDRVPSPRGGRGSGFGLLPQDAVGLRPGLPAGFVDARYADLESLMEAVAAADPEVVRWQRAVRLMSAQRGECRAVAWWDTSADRTERLAAMEALRDGWVREQWRLEADVDFYHQPRAVRQAVLRLKDRCDNPVHFEKQLQQLSRQMAGLGETLAQQMAPRDRRLAQRLNTSRGKTVVDRRSAGVLEPEGRGTGGVTHTEESAVLV